jgi:hypothetical protein
VACTVFNQSRAAILESVVCDRVPIGLHCCLCVSTCCM